MTKTFVSAAIAASVLAGSLSSCASILGGSISECQKTKPAAGQPAREVRTGALVADILLTGAVGVIIDFATGAIYKPCSK